MSSTSIKSNPNSKEMEFMYRVIENLEDKPKVCLQLFINILRGLPSRCLCYRFWVLVLYITSRIVYIYISHCLLHFISATQAIKFQIEIQSLTYSHV